VVVDDGIATGSTARAACRVARAHGAARVVLAVPVAPAGWTVSAGNDADVLICLDTLEDFLAISQFYRDFAQTTDDEVISCLERADSIRVPPVAAVPRAGLADDLPERDEDVDIAAGDVQLAAYLTVPAGARGIVVFAHGSGSSRLSPRNRFVAGVLNEAGLGTLLFDLLTPEEEADRANVFDIGLLAGRLVDVTRWLVARLGVRSNRIGYFGASTGAAAALWASTDVDVDIAAVVSRGGRPDLVGSRLPVVTAPTLLVVGSRDGHVLDLNWEAQSRLRCEHRLAVVPGATHLFEESGTLREAAELARDWFLGHFASARHWPADKGGSDPPWRDPFLEAAREAADGVELFEDPFGDEAVLSEQESAQGVEVFVNPDAVIPATALVEGSPGHEMFAGDKAGLGEDHERETREEPAEEPYGEWRLAE
jgi:putative phosphoribosyl transferase